MMPARVDWLRTALQVGLYTFFFVLFLTIFALSGAAVLMGVLAGSAIGTFLAALVANVITLRIYEARKLADIGFHWNRASAHNLAWGLAGGTMSAVAVLAGPILAHASSLQAVAGGGSRWPAFVFVTLILIFGAAGEEILFRGYGFQVLLRNLGPFATILPVGLVFGALHYTNPHITRIGLLNTAGFGVLFGYAFLRSRDLWLPFGLHFGWNFILPLFGADVSGIKIRVTGYELQWTSGTLWSGGDYGPEASLVTSGMLAVLFVFLWKAPIRPQPNLLLDEPVEN